MTEGASGQCSSGLLWGVVLDRGYRYPDLHRSNDTGRVREVMTCISYRAKLTTEALRALASGALLSCPGKKVSKEAGSRGEQLAPARIVPPLRIPRVEPTGIDPSLWLGWWVSASAPVLACGVWGCFFPTLSIESMKKPGIAQWNDTGRGGVPPLSMRAQRPCFRSPFCSVTIPGTGGAVTIC